MFGQLTWQLHRRHQKEYTAALSSSAVNPLFQIPDLHAKRCSLPGSNLHPRASCSTEVTAEPLQLCLARLTPTSLGPPVPLSLAWACFRTELSS